ncbi:hypothetical protein PLESTB_001367100 [Pleodorina starrii]|uniref:Uncharacterized protein n=1 Tax=Pleodorina starrii TaxID=330485 RepID=A0A9W6BUM1_9CHLO|nr:hypothetical protein PLESTM_000418100 [Pleodorina starrii]GLC58493.1 hypothetical protein PLESTB_001367100 [Pleodorina starrii]GLC74148.1 hypothetical protein PLESTF_001467100 [Pleodorina starrii]
MTEPRAPGAIQGGPRGLGGRRRPLARWRPADIVWGTCLGLVALILLLYGWHLRSRAFLLADSDYEPPPPSSEGATRRRSPYDGYDTDKRVPPYSSAPLLVSYAFYEKDVIQRTNFEFFLQHGWVAPPGDVRPVTTTPITTTTTTTITWVFVITGELCSPCVGAFPVTTQLAADPAIGISRAARIDGDPEDVDVDVEAGGGGARLAGPAAAAAAAAGRRRRAAAGSGGGGGGGVSALSGLHGGPPAGPTLLLWRGENVGMDLAAHNISLEYLQRHAGGIRRYRYFLFLNSSVKGPYLPAYLPPWWHWTHAFLERFQPLPEGDPRWTRPPTLQVLPPGTPYGHRLRNRPVGPPVVRAVGCSLVCLPEADAGGPGPRLESWAVAVDDVGMELLIRKGVFKVRTCKTCSDKDEGIIVGGEYGITSVLLEAGYNVATLMSKYARDVDWRDERHWACNDMVHPSRHGTYDGIAFHPYETVFVKSSWHVADPYTRRYSLWMTQHREGDAGTDGEWNEKLYRYAISSEAQQSNLLEAAYAVDKVRETLARHRQQEDASAAEEARVAGERTAGLNV